jgi:hypothetical protein
LSALAVRHDDVPRAVSGDGAGPPGGHVALVESLEVR